MNVKRLLVPFFAAWLPLAAMALGLSQTPLFIASTEPRLMLALSRDHQLSIKAYTDYSDLNGDGVLDITYNDSLEYYGYFDPKKCYSYSSGVYVPETATNTGTHQCSGYWSGNFMNWASMTRMDVLRKVLYGGMRYVDTASTTSTTGQTILERHFLPRDVHSFVKVFNPGSSATLSLYVPSGVVGTNTSMSFCNVSYIDTTKDEYFTGTESFWPEGTDSFASSTTHPAPLMKVAAGNWAQWASSEILQCELGSGTKPAALIGEDSGYKVRVEVCKANLLEDNCKDYSYVDSPSGSTVKTTKPTGLLQTYADVDAEQPVRFGLITGTYGKNISGGVVRKNTGYITDPSGSCGDNGTQYEIDNCTGKFINQNKTDVGIINSLNRIRIGYYTTDTGSSSKYYNNDSSGGCGYGWTTFAEGNCKDWGSPMSEIYLEALRYFSGLTATTDFSYDDTSIITGLTKESAWIDPLPSSEWCAISNIVVLSTGLGSFDSGSTQLASFTPLSGSSSVSAASLTKTVGDLEGITGNSYLIGANGTDNNKLCTGKTVTDLFSANGICPEFPNGEGGYGIAGLAYAPKTLDLRPAYAAGREDRWSGINSAWVARQPINTYAVQLAESLPSFTIPVGSNKVTLLPYCTSGTSIPRSICSMNNLWVDSNVSKASVGTDSTAKTNTCSGNGTTSGCFTMAWEDSSWGGDYDMDGMQRIGYCVGSACNDFRMLCPSTTSPNDVVDSDDWGTIDDGKLLVATCAIQADSGAYMRFGYSIAGTTGDGAFEIINRPAGNPAGCSSSSPDPTNNAFIIGCKLPAEVDSAKWSTFTPGTSSASLLKNPLWYAAKYGGFTDSNSNGIPDLQSEWDTDNDGVPDNYYDVRNPANLISAMAEILDAASKPDASAASVATNSTNLQIESRVYQAKFSSADWSGQLLQYRIETDGTLGATSEWDASTILNTLEPNDRMIITKNDTDGVVFEWGNLTTAQQGLLNTTAAGVTDTLGDERVDYLRGNQSNEGTTGTLFRKRETSVLGDIVNSSPLHVGAPKGGYSDVDHPGYSSFRDAYADRKSVVYVGGNDGMLHGFDASLDFTDPDVPEGEPTSDAGKEILAYVPSRVYANLSRLTDRKYNQNHRYFVDGSPMMADIDLDSSNNNDWRTVLIGDLGAGGKGLFALDITDPDDFLATNAADLLLWEFTEVDDVDMGYVFNHPPSRLSNNQAKQIVKMANGKWAAIFGNGYNSTDGKAVLYIAFIEDGDDVSGWQYSNSATSDYVKLVAETAGSNGLSTPVPFDSNGDGFADVVYAGDLKGNMWKFLVGPNASDASVTSDPTTWKVAFSLSSCASTNTCHPLFTAKDDADTVQPVIWPPEVTLHPSGGQMVLFGTGKFMEASDVADTSDQTFYGIWDRHDNTTTVGSRADDLLEQTVTLTPIVVDGVSTDYRVPSDNPTDLPIQDMYRQANCDDSDDANPCDGRYLGWYMDLPTDKERLTGVPKLINGVIFFNTYIPSASVCSQGGTGWLMALDYFNGGLVDFWLFDTNNDGIIDSHDTLVGGLNVGAALGGTTLIQGTNSAGVGVSSLSSGSMSTVLINFGPGAGGRITWREIVQ